MAGTKVKKYYWLKLKESFFREREVKKMRRLENGAVYTIIYLKMQLLSLKNEGCLIFEGTEDSMFEQLALELDEDEAMIKETIDFSIKNTLLEIDGDEYFLTRVPEVIGVETDKAELMRRKRAKDKNTENSNNVTDELPPVTDSYHDVTGSNAPVTNCYTEKEKRVKEKIEDLKKEKYQESDSELDSDLNINLLAQQLEQKRLAKIAEVNKHTKPVKSLEPLVIQSIPPPPSKKSDISLSDEDIIYFMYAWSNMNISPPIKELTQKQIQKLDENITRFKGDGENSLDAICNLIDNITDSNYLLGETEHKFKLILNWVLKAENWEKIINGEYCSWDESESED